MTGNIKKIYPSSAAFMLGAKVDSAKNHSCPRYLWTMDRLPEQHSDIPEEYAALGLLNEARVALIYDDGKIPYKREVRVTKDFNGCKISGKIDFVLYPDTAPIYIETKATSSKNVRRDVLTAQTPDLNHLAQLVTYMMLDNVRNGQIIVSYYETDAGRLSFQVVEEHTFIVEILDSGVLTVDGKVFNKSTKDLARWYKVVSESLTTDAVPDMPAPTGSYYKNICRFCPLVEVFAYKTKL